LDVCVRVRNFVKGVCSSLYVLFVFV